MKFPLQRTWLEESDESSLLREGACGDCSSFSPKQIAGPLKFSFSIFIDPPLMASLFSLFVLLPVSGT